MNRIYLIWFQFKEPIKNPLLWRKAGGLRAETRPPGQEEGSGRDRPTRGLWDSLSLVPYKSKRGAN